MKKENIKTEYYGVNTPTSGTIDCNESTVGEMLEDKIKRALENQEPMDESLDLIFTERADGVQYEYDPRGDKWEMAVEAMGNKNKSEIAKRTEILQKKKEADNPEETTKK